MTEGEQKADAGSVSDGLRPAVERTLSATAGTAAETAERAQELLDEVAKRGIEARDEVSRRGQRTREGLAKIRFASADEVNELNQRLQAMDERLAAIESALTALSANNPKSKLQG
ncbi:MAG: hypothetical protein ACR2OC_08860 [Solirubrobacterales bacterium]